MSRKNEHPAMSLFDYEDLGFLSAAPPERSISLFCDKCMVKWTGCQDQAECPRCGDTEAWRQYMELMKMIYERDKSAE